MTMKIKGRQVGEELEKDMSFLFVELNLKHKYKNKYISLFLFYDYLGFF